MFLHRLFSALKFWVAISLTLLLVLFAIVNREFIAISLFPLPYAIELPKFLLAIICFGAGLLRNPTLNARFAANRSTGV